MVLVAPSSLTKSQSPVDAQVTDALLVIVIGWQRVLCYPNRPKPRSRNQLDILISEVVILFEQVVAKLAFVSTARSIWTTPTPFWSLPVTMQRSGSKDI